MKLTQRSLILIAFAGVLATGAFACKGSDGTGGAGGTGTTSSTGSKMTSSSSKATGTTTGSSMTTGTGGGPACGLLYDDRPDCEACMEGACCSEMTECDPSSTTDCGKLLACANACAANDSACVDACVAADPGGAGLAAYQEMVSCYDTNCATDQACVYPICDSGVTIPDQGCADCLTTSCCTEFTACVGDMGCAGCYGQMLNPGDACGTAGSPSDMLWQSQQTCEGTTCKADCTFAICGSDLGYPNNSHCNSCLSDNCCTSFDACEGDAACKNCLTGAGTGCDTNTLFKAFTDCRDNPGANTCGDAGECN